ncbi:MAG TPA: hypothetical protein VMS43_13490 [Allosphingosinicella sp.]|nr:hypothetical protein [Allosphingosinicella sp.]
MTATQDIQLQERVIEDIDPLDAMLGTDDIYQLGNQDVAAIDDLRLNFTRRAVDHHRQHNSAYDQYCERLGFKNDRLSSAAELATIPLLSTGLFKRGDQTVRTGSGADQIILTTSSGTLGTVSVVPRDDVTLKRFFASVAIGKREVLGVETFDRQVFDLTPATRDAPNVWVSYVMAGVGVLYTTRSYVRRDVLAMKELVADLASVPDNEGINVVGPPPLLLDLARYLEEHGPLKLSPKSLIIAIGGWKRRENEIIDRTAFDERLASAFGFPDTQPIRDSYNMVELNTVLFECAFKAKHSPPWITVLARDPRTLAALPSGEPGLLSFLDPTPLSYPGFILSDDFGTVTQHTKCPCGITGDVIVFERRVNRIESRGCALKLQTIGA